MDSEQEASRTKSREQKADLVELRPARGCWSGDLLQRRKRENSGLFLIPRRHFKPVAFSILPSCKLESRGGCSLSQDPWCRRRSCTRGPADGRSDCYSTSGHSLHFLCRPLRDFKFFLIRFSSEETNIKHPVLDTCVPLCPQRAAGALARGYG